MTANTFLEAVSSLAFGAGIGLLCFSLGGMLAAFSETETTVVPVVKELPIPEIKKELVGPLQCPSTVELQNEAVYALRHPGRQYAHIRVESRCRANLLNVGLRFKARGFIIKPWSIGDVMYYTICYPNVIECEEST